MNLESENGMFSLFLDAAPGIFMIVNSNREILCASGKLLEIIGTSRADLEKGMKTGAAIHCVNSLKAPGGCGTSENCGVCGINSAVKVCAASAAGTEHTQECRVTRRGSGEPLDLRIWARKIERGGDYCIVIALADISDEKRRHALERIFFHDIMNMAGGIQGALSMLCSSEEPDQTAHILEILSKSASALVDEIKAQRQLLMAEKGELKPVFENCGALDELHQIADIYRAHEASAGKLIIVDLASQTAPIKTDKTILRRVLGNMIKNALEATREGGIVTASSRVLPESGEIEYRVHNDNFIPKYIQMQIFQRSFSTKGADRGLGTYSIKMLTERYLGGKAAFESSEEKGADFFIRLKCGI